MQERARAFGGALTIITGLEEGFEFHLEVPIDD
jgi:signal transduction histidine kinase